MRTNQTLAVVFLAAWVVLQGSVSPPVHAANAANPVAAARVSAEADFGEFSAALAPYGRWLEVAGYGTCWSPDVELHWAPYTEGYWAYTDAGWTWVSREPFGSIVFHYGRWLMTSEGWCWVPGQDWGPAWVSWRTGDKYVGWAPLPPEVPWNAKRGVGSWVDVQSDIGPGYYRFCRVEDFGSPDMREVVFPVDRNSGVFVTTRNVTHITVREETVFCAGPSYVWITTHCAQPVPVLRVIREPSINVFVSYGAGLGFAGFISRDCLFLPAPLRVCKPQPHHFAVAPVQVQRQTTRGWSADRHEMHDVSKYVSQEWEKQRTTLTAKTPLPAGGAAILNEIRQAPRPVSEQERQLLLVDSQHPKTPLHSTPPTHSTTLNAATPTSSTSPAFPASLSAQSKQATPETSRGGSQRVTAGSFASGSLKAVLLEGSLDAAPAAPALKSAPALRDPFSSNSFVPPTQTPQRPAAPTVPEKASPSVGTIATPIPATNLRQTSPLPSSSPAASTAPTVTTRIQNPVETPKTAAPTVIRNAGFPAASNVPPPAPVNHSIRPTPIAPAPATNPTNGRSSQFSNQTVQPSTQIISTTEIGRQPAPPAQPVISTRSAIPQAQQLPQSNVAPQTSRMESGRTSVPASPFGTSSVNPQLNTGISTRQAQPSITQSLSIPSNTPRPIPQTQSLGNSNFAFPAGRSAVTTPVQSSSSFVTSPQPAPSAPRPTTTPPLTSGTATTSSPPTAPSKPKTTDPNAPKP